MKKKSILCSLILFAVFAVTAQTYRCVDTSAVRFFIQPDSRRIEAIRIDTILQASGGVLYKNFTTFRDTSMSGGCLDVVGPGWMGPGVLEMNNGTSVLFNQFNDSIRIRTEANPGECWTLYSFANGDFYEACVTTVVDEIVCGISDSVKNISLQRKNSAHINVNDNLNGKLIRLSRQHGFVQLPSFYNFPFSAFYKLKDMHMPTVAEFFDWQVGDEFHFKRKISYNYMPSEVIYRIERVVGATPGITYDLNIRKWDIEYSWSGNPPVPTTTSTYTDTVITKPLYSPNNPFTYQLPGESAIVFDTDYGISFPEWNFEMYLDSGNCYDAFRFEFSDPEIEFDEFDSCWKPIFEPCFSGETCIAGIGCFESDGCPVHYYFNEESLVYYKKGTVECGTPISIPDDQPRSPLVRISPNPFSTFISFTVDEAYIDQNLRVDLYDMYGRLVKQVVNSGSNILTLYRDQLSPGLYGFAIFCGKDLIGKGKIVAE